MTKQARKKQFLLGTSLFWLIVLFGFAPSANADTVYTYTGNPFTNFNGSYACPPQ